MADGPFVSLGRPLKELRLRRGYSQPYVSIKVGKSETYYGKIELGYRFPPRPILIKMLEVLDATEQETSEALEIWKSIEYPPELYDEVSGSSPRLALALQRLWNMLPEGAMRDNEFQRIWAEVGGFYRERKKSRRWYALVRQVELIKESIPGAPARRREDDRPAPEPESN